MPVVTRADKPSSHRLAQAAIILVSLLLVLSAVACALSVVGVRQGALELPAFSLRMGHLELTAPCPAIFGCDIHLPYYAVWFGHDLPDGSVQYQQLYFVWLPKKKP